MAGDGRPNDEQNESPAVPGESPLDITTMTAAVSTILSCDGEPPTGDALASLTRQLRGHLNLLIPELEQRFVVEGPREVASVKAGIGEARCRLSAGPGSLGPVRHATLLARSVEALRRHFQRLVPPG